MFFSLANQSSAGLLDVVDWGLAHTTTKILSSNTVYAAYCAGIHDAATLQTVLTVVTVLPPAA